MRTRHATLNDTQAIIDLLIEAHGQSAHKTPYDREIAMRNMAGFIASPSVLTRVLDSGGIKGVIVGVLAPVWSSAHKIPADLVFYVSTSHRGGGPKLLREFQRWASQFDSAVEMQNSVTMGGEEGERAEGFYMKSGYRRIGGIFSKEIKR